MRRLKTLKEVLEDFLREQGLTVDDILDAMDEDPKGILESLTMRVSISEEEALKFLKLYSSRQLNLAIFAIQVFYLSNPSGYYKGYLIYPTPDMVRGPDGLITKEGLILILRSLGLKPGYA